MQIINVYSGNVRTAATNLKNALTQYASDYFDSFETDFTDSGGKKIVKCMIGETAVVEIVYKSEALYLKLNVNGLRDGIYYSMSYQYIISEIYVCENAICLRYGRLDNQSTLADIPLLLCKKKNGDTALVFFCNENITQFATLGTGTKYCCVLSVSRSTGAADFSLLPTYFFSNSNNKVSGYSLFSFNDGILLKDVFLVVDSDFRSHTQPFTYTLNNVTYTGFCGNYFAVKGA